MTIARDDTTWPASLSKGHLMITIKELFKDQLAGQLEALSNEELRDLIIRCEEAIAEGDAQVNTFEAFIRCQQELSRRTWN